MTRSDASTLPQVVGDCMHRSGGANVRPVAAAPGDEPNDPSAVEAQADTIRLRARGGR